LGGELAFATLLVYFFMKMGASFLSDECKGALGFALASSFSSTEGSTISPAALTFKLHAPDLMALMILGFSVL
jgi:hypothetical protein